MNMRAQNVTIGASWDTRDMRDNGGGMPAPGYSALSINIIFRLFFIVVLHRHAKRSWKGWLLGPSGSLINLPFYLT